MLLSCIVSSQQVQNASFCVPNTRVTSHSYIFLIHRRINVSRTYAHHSKKALARSLPVARTRSSSRLLRLPSGIVAVQCLRCLRSTSIAPSGQQSAWHTHSRPIHGRGMRGGYAAALGAGGAGAALPRWAALQRAVRGRQPPHALPRAGVGSHGVAWRGGTHPDARRVVEAADEDAVEVEVAQPPAAPGTSEKRPAGANAPTGG